MATIPVIWIPAVAFGNVFAFYFIFMMLAAVNPMLSRKIESLKACFGVKKKGDVGRRASAGDNRLPADAQNGSKGKGVDVEAAPSGAVSEDDQAPHAVARRVTMTKAVVVNRLTLEWTNIGCTYRIGATEKVVLKEIYGKAMPNEMLALMGPSGAGKSTLLDILTMRKNTGLITGEVMVNGEGRQTNFLRTSSYVPQEDNFVPTMTTAETLTFYAKLVLPSSTSSKTLRNRVDEVLTMVGLKAQKNTMVGGMLPGGIALRGLSGGERRRLNLAVGVVASPSIIFLDEPTSGLDSFAALNVMQYMKSMAELKSHTIIASIHQPRMGIWNMFNKVVILSKGNLMYWGPTSDVVNWFSGKLGYKYDAGIHGVVSDWAMDLVSIGFSKPQAHYGRSMRTEADVLQASSEFKSVYLADVKKQHGNVPEVHAKPEGKLQTGVLRRTTTHYMVDLERVQTPEPIKHSDAAHGAGSKGTSLVRVKRAVLKTDKYNSSWLTQFLALSWRSYLNITRNPADVAGRMLTFTYIAVFIGLIFYDRPDDVSSLLTRLNIIYNSTAFFMFIPYVSMSLFTSDRAFYSADITAQLYHPSAYYVANVLSNVPFSIANASVFGLIVYGMAGLRDDTGAIFQHLGLLVVQSLIALQVLYFAAVVTKNQDTAFMLAITFTAVNILLSNYFIPFDQIRFGWISIIHYISAMAYTFEGLVQLEFEGVVFNCSEGTSFLGVNSNDLTRQAFPGVEENNPIVLNPVVSNTLENPGDDCIFNGTTIVNFFDLERSYGESFAILVGYLAILHVLTFLGLTYLAKKGQK
eukprot:evm.model.scf_884EXC.7 EVM.evm.TU.scf_884EXC.7   scf_884EXC:39023-46896(-)